MRYLQAVHLESAIARGKSVEQFLGGFEHAGEPVIRYLTIRAQGAEFWLHIHELHDQGSASYFDLYDFIYLDLPADRFEPFPLTFSSLAAALSHASSGFGAATDRWVNQGVVQDEYADFKRSQPQV